MEKIEEENGRRIMKRFSIIMAAYNAEKEIENAIKSVLNQTFKNFEFIVVNDASTDTTAEIVSRYGDVKLISHIENKRAGGARNTGLDNASGEYIIFLDSDDILADQNVLAKIDEKIGKDAPDIIYLGFKSIGEALQGEFIPNEHNSIKENRIVEWKYENVWDVCWRKEYLDINKIRFVEGKYFEDFMFYYKGVLKSSSYKFIDFVSIVYQSGRPDSMTTFVNYKKIKDLYFNMEELLDLYNEVEEKYKKYIVQAIKRSNDYVIRMIDMME